MENTRTRFYGKQTDERILYLIQPHKIALTLNLIKVYSAAVAILVCFLLIGKLISGLGGLIGIFLAILVVFLGSMVARISHRKNKTYITDRRIVRFEPTTLFATNTRTLSWDEVVKVKTYPPNFFLKAKAIGTVVIHARTTVRAVDNELKPSPVTADDIELTHVYYYRDLGNYIDKILYTYKQKPKEMKKIKPFVEKPKGQRD